MDADTLAHMRAWISRNVPAHLQTSAEDRMLDYIAFVDIDMSCSDRTWTSIADSAEVWCP